MFAIRTATDADAGEVLTLQRAAWVPEAQVHGWLFIPPLTQTLDELRADITGQTFLVAVDGHRIIGTVRATLIDADSWYVGRLGVAPDRQGEGIGRALLVAIEAAAPASARRCTLTTGPKSVENQAFYERHGYVRVAAADHTQEHLVHLAKPIRATPSQATQSQATQSQATPSQATRNQGVTS